MTDDVFAGLEGIFDNVDEEEVVDVTTMSNGALLNLVQELTQDLLDAKQGIRPDTQDARDKHSLRNAAQVELRNRKIPI